MPEADAIKPAIPIACAPVFDKVETAGFEVVVEEMPKTYPRQLSNMRAVIYDHIKTLWCCLAGNAIEKRRVLLHAVIKPNAPARIVDLEGIKIQPDDQSLSKVISPKKH